jgi:hypothetical protein
VDDSAGTSPTQYILLTVVQEIVRISSCAFSTEVAINKGAVAAYFNVQNPSGDGLSKDHSWKSKEH